MRLRLKDKRRLVLGIIGIILALGMTALGVWRGELPVVWQKAANICFECIGLG